MSLEEERLSEHKSEVRADWEAGPPLPPRADTLLLSPSSEGGEIPFSDSLEFLKSMVKLDRLSWWGRK